jgi:hypothetical protein
MLTQADADRWRNAAKDKAVVDWRSALPVNKAWAHILPDGKLVAHMRIPRSEIERKVGINEATTMLQSMDDKFGVASPRRTANKFDLNPLEGDKKEFIPISQQGKDQLSLDDAPLPKDDLEQLLSEDGLRTDAGKQHGRRLQGWYSSVAKAVTGDDRRRYVDRRRRAPTTRRRRGFKTITASCYDDASCDDRRRRGIDCGDVTVEIEHWDWFGAGFYLYYRYTDSEFSIGFDWGTGAGDEPDSDMKCTFWDTSSSTSSCMGDDGNRPAICSLCGSLDLGGYQNSAMSAVGIDCTRRRRRL